MTPLELLDVPSGYVFSRKSENGYHPSHHQRPSLLKYVVSLNSSRTRWPVLDLVDQFRSHPLDASRHSVVVVVLELVKVPNQTGTYALLRRAVNICTHL